MIIEIRGAGFVNKGAELMLLAVIQQVRNRYPEAKLIMAPIYGGADNTFERMRDLRLYPKAWLWRYGFDWGIFARFVPKRLLTMHGLILDQDVDVVIDAAGFAYSDQWGTRNSRELASSSTKWRKNGTKLIMLPQAMGPFNEDNIGRHVKRWVRNADRIFVREPDSYKYLTDLVGKLSKISIYPDFTNLLQGSLPIGYDPTDKRIALVPNYRMIDKTNKEESDAYLPFMIRCAKYLVAQGAKPFILVHEGENDQMLANRISVSAGGIAIVKEIDPLHIKGILGSCHATIGSRFHGLVSALSQGVPSLCTGWSHKYSRLFDDYRFGEGVISVLDSDEILHEKMNMLVDPRLSAPLRGKLTERSTELKRLSEEMWDLVFQEIDKKSVNTRLQ